MLRIGFEAKRAFHNFRGLGNYSRTLLHGLEHYANFNKYFLFTPPFKDERAVDWHKNHGNLEVVTPQSFLMKMVPSLWRSFSMAKDAKNCQLDLFHGLSQEMPFTQLGSKTKKVVTVHDLLYLKFPQFFSLIDRNIYRKKVQAAVEQSDLILAICQQTKEDLQQHLQIAPEKISVCYQSCSPQFYEICPEEACQSVLQKYGLQFKSYLLYVGAFEENKNAVTLIRAYKGLADAPPLVLIGRGKRYLKKILEEGKELLARKRLIILENVGFEELPYFYRAAILFCFPSIYEGFGIPIIESLFQGTPVLTSKGGVFPEAAGDGALYADAGNWEEWKENLELLISDQKLQQKLGQIGVEQVQKFHLKNTTEDLLGHYQRLISQS